VAALYYAARLHQLRREAQATQERAEEAMALATEQGLPLWLAGGMILRGWALAAQGHGAAGVVQIRQGLAARQTPGEEIARPYYLALLAEAYAHMGQTDAALQVLTEALAAVHRRGERFYEAELYRLKGELLQHAERGMQHTAYTPEACFRQARDIARGQRAKWLELRAVRSWSGLQQQGKPAETRELLAPIYGWFTEGFDTADFQEAKSLLDELA
jgi:predicted ATPase